MEEVEDDYFGLTSDTERPSKDGVNHVLQMISEGEDVLEKSLVASSLEEIDSVERMIPLTKSENILPVELKEIGHLVSISELTLEHVRNQLNAHRDAVWTTLDHMREERLAPLSEELDRTERAVELLDRRLIFLKTQYSSFRTDEHLQKAFDNVLNQYFADMAANYRNYLCARGIDTDQNAFNALIQRRERVVIDEVTSWHSEFAKEGKHVNCLLRAGPQFEEAVEELKVATQRELERCKMIQLRQMDTRTELIMAWQTRQEKAAALLVSLRDDATQFQLRLVECCRGGGPDDIVQLLEDISRRKQQQVVRRSSKSRLSKQMVTKLLHTFAVGDGMTAMHLACLFGNVAVLRYLLEVGMSVKVLSKGRTPAYFAVAYHGMACTEMLEMLSAFPGYADCGDLRLSASKWLTEHKFDSLANRLASSRTLLHEACTCGNTLAVKWLLEHKFEPSLRLVNSLETPLHIACWKGFFRVVKILLRSEQGQTLPTLLNALGESPIEVAIRFKRVEIVRLLAEQGHLPSKDAVQRLAHLFRADADAMALLKFPFFIALMWPSFGFTQEN